MTTFLGVVSGILYFVGLLLLAATLYPLQKDLLGKPRRFLQVIPIHGHIQKGRVLLFLGLIPRTLLFYLLWPIQILWIKYRAHRLGISVQTLEQLEARETFLIASNRAADGSFYFPIFGGVTIVGGASLAILWDSACPFLLLWLGFIWVAMLLWLLSYFLPNNSFSLLLRLDPDHFKKNLFALTLLLGLSFPVVSSVLAVHLNKAPLTWPEVLSALAGLYALGGVLWEGPKAALAGLGKQPGDLIQLLTGSLLYLVIITKLKALVTDRFSAAELLTAATSKLMLGDRESTEKLLDRLPADNPKAWELRIVSALMGGRGERAQALSKAKVDDLDSISRNLDVAVGFHLANLTLSWKTPREAQEAIWKSFIAAGPSEQELLTFWTLLNPVFGSPSGVEPGEARWS